MVLHANSAKQSQSAIPALFGVIEPSTIYLVKKTGLEITNVCGLCYYLSEFLFSVFIII